MGLAPTFSCVTGRRLVGFDLEGMLSDFLAGRPGLEPRSADLETAMLPIAPPACGAGDGTCTRGLLLGKEARCSSATPAKYWSAHGELHSDVQLGRLAHYSCAMGAWWRRRELHPGPGALHEGVYARSRRFALGPSDGRRRPSWGHVPDFSRGPSTGSLPDPHAELLTSHRHYRRPGARRSRLGRGEHLALAS